MRSTSSRQSAGQGIAIERALRGRSTLQYTATARFMRVLSFTLIGTMELKLAPKGYS